jgi:hypothetical protein
LLRVVVAGLQASDSSALRQAQDVLRPERHREERQLVKDKNFD